MTTPLVSIIIPTFNESAVIERNLKALINQKYHSTEIIVVDDSSTDTTPQIARKFTSHVYQRPHAERSVQRNFGAKKARGEYFLFLDADMEVTADVVANCVKLATSKPHIGGIAIPETPIATNFLEQIKAFERSFYSKYGDPDTDAARFFSKKAFTKAGGYDETLTGPEDWDLPERITKLGFTLGRITSRINHYERIPSLTKLLKKKYYYGLTAHRYLKNHQINPIGPKTIYFLRPIFYRNWRTLLSQPLLTVGMVIVFCLELCVGGVGFMVGKIKSL